MIEDVDLIEGQPVMHQPFEFRKESRNKILIKTDHPAAAPSPVLFDEMDGAVEMGDGDKRLYIVLSAFPEKLSVKFYAFTVWLRFVSFRIDPGPGYGHAVN